MNPPGWIPSHRALLQILLDDASAARGLDWLAGVSLDALDHETSRLLPALYHRLRAAGVEESRLPARLKGMVRHAWTRNQALLAESFRALDLLSARGIEWMLVGGAAAMASTWGDISARPLRDFDVLVREGNVAEACAALREAGWRTAVRDPDRLLAWFHRMRWTAPHGLLDLHVRPLLEDRDAENLSRAWTASGERTLGGRSVRVPPPELLLLQICVAGWFTPRPPALVWVLDAAALLRAGGVEPDRLAAVARRAGLAGPLDWSLGVLQSACPGLVPESLRMALPKPIPPGSLRGHAAWGALPRLWRAHRAAGARSWFPSAARDALGISLAQAAARRLRRGSSGAAP